MRRNNKKKGFTIVELVIVIAVIAILAAVMIPTFTSIISDANEKAALQEANAMYKNYLASVDYTKGDAAENLIFEVKDSTDPDSEAKYVVAIGGKIQETVYDSQADAQAAYTNAYKFTVVKYSTANNAAADAVETEASTVDGTKPTETAKP